MQLEGCLEIINYTPQMVEIDVGTDGVDGWYRVPEKRLRWASPMTER